MRIAACFLLAIALIASAFAQEFKGVTYKKPAGWDEAIEGDAKLFVPKDLKEGELLAIIMTGAVPSNGSSWEKQFTDTIALANDGGKVSGEGKVEMKEGSGMTLLVQSLNLDHKEIGKHSRVYAQVSQGEQRVFVTVLIGKESLMEKYGEGVADFLGNIGFKTAPTVKTSTAPTPVKGKIPTGNTPNLFISNEGWLPSGRGLPIPPAKVVNGKPQGLWWRLDQTSSGLKPLLQLFMPNGVQTKFPRMGGGMLFDYEGEKAQSGTNSLGTFTVANGMITESLNGYDQKRPFSAGSDADGAFFRAGGFQFRPLVPMTYKSLAGVWVSKSSEYEFREDGTYESGTLRSTAQWSQGAMVKGRYILDGFLLMLVPENGTLPTVERFGLAGNMIAKSGTFYVRKK
jgi:hypothetical protein